MNVNIKKVEKIWSEMGEGWVVESNGRRDVFSAKATRPDLFCDAVVIESICSRTTAKRLINESKTTGWQKKLDGKFYDKVRKVAKTQKSILIQFRSRNFLTVFRTYLPCSCYISSRSRSSLQLRFSLLLLLLLFLSL